jgi:hypothetical protein
MNKDLFLRLGLRSPEPDAILNSIEIFGIPGSYTKAGEPTITPKTRKFFDDLIARTIFQEARRLPDCNFEYLKIWLYDTETPDAERGYDVPQLDARDLEIRSNQFSSQLQFIYVLDNPLTVDEYQQWRQTTNRLFRPLFRNFTMPPEPPSELTENPMFQAFVESPLGKAFQSFNKNLDPNLELKKNLFFNALIIQID